MTQLNITTSADVAPEATSVPLVSIVITTYNHARFLAEAIESALSQSACPVEVIVVDDGSTDDPAAIAARFPGIHLIRQANQGLAAARNTGWLAARGRYLVFLDADDRLLPGAVAANLRRFARHPDCAFVYGAYRMIDAEGSPIGLPQTSEIGRDAYETLLRGNCIGMHATVMYRRDRLAAAGGFEAELPACEDYELYLRLARRHPVVSGPECIAEYRQHDANMSRDIPLMLDAALDVLRRQRPHLDGNPRWRAAYVTGIRGWKSHYAGRLLGRLYKGVRRSENWRVSPGAIFKVLRLAPVAFSGAVLRGLAKLLRGRVRLLRGSIELGDLRRVSPISPCFGYDRGNPVDRRYIEGFLAGHAADIRGRVLEIGDNAYTMRFGGARVTRSDVLHVSGDNPQATFIGDLADGDNLPSDAFDCIVLTQTLHLIFDLRKATATLFRILKPGGVLLVTVPGVSSIDRGEWGHSWYWSLTPAALGRLLEERFSASGLAVTAYGNVLTALAFLHGLAEHELRPEELDAHDPHYPVIVAARAVKRVGPEHARAAKP